MSIEKQDFKLLSNQGSIGIHLKDYQLAFINKCKNLGLTGCFITVNNNQIWISFINNN